jgi:hypothetical protein
MFSARCMAHQAGYKTAPGMHVSCLFGAFLLHQMCAETALLILVMAQSGAWRT